MNGAKTPLLNAYAESNLDMMGYKILNVDLSALSSGFPASDAVALVKNAADATKLIRFNLAGLTTGTTRVFVLPNYSGTLVTLAGTEALTGKSLNGLAFATGTPGAYTIQVDGNVTFGFGFTTAGAGIVLTAVGPTSVTLPTTGVLATVAGTQPANAQLTVLAALTSTTVGQSLLTLANPSAIRFLRVNADNTVTARTAAEMQSDLGVATVPFIDNVSLIRGSADATKTVRFEVDTNVPTLTTRVLTIPAVDGTLALVATTIPSSALNTDTNLKPYSDTDVPSQLAVYQYIKARIGTGVKSSSDYTVASAGLIDLGPTNGQVQITGTTPIATITQLSQCEHKP